MAKPKGSNIGWVVAVGTALSGRPPHRSQRAELPHWAPTSGSDAQTQPAVSGPAHCADFPGPASGVCFVGPDSPWSAAFPPHPPPVAAHRSLCSGASQVLRSCPTSWNRSSTTCPPGVLAADRATISARPVPGSLGSRMKGLSARTGSSTTRDPNNLAFPVDLMLPLAQVDSGGVPFSM